MVIVPINFTSYVSQVQSLSITAANGEVTGQKKVRHDVTRALQRLKSVFVSLMRDVPADELDENLGSKSWNNF